VDPGLSAYFRRSSAGMTTQPFSEITNAITTS
jgi:hypothetical protein